MQILNDEEILYNAFCRYQECCGTKSLPSLGQGKIITLRSQMLQQLEKYVLLLGSDRTSVVEYSSICGKGKKLYQKYCFQLKVNPELHKERLAKKMDELLHHMAAWEAKKVLRFRETQPAGDKINLEILFQEEKNIRALLSSPVDSVLEANFIKKKYTVVGKDEQAIFMTASGSKYHRRDCPYCRGKNLLPTTRKTVENIGLTPCKCMEVKTEEMKDVKERVSIIKRSLKSQPYVTAYVDESIRTNPWKEMDESIPEKQSLFGYILCNGLITSENLITEQNTMYTQVISSKEIESTGVLAIEAIMAVLFRLVAMGYKDNVMIYTDNQEAKESWYQSPACNTLAKLFNGVTVCIVPRKGNKKADKLVRESAFMELSTETMERIQGRSKNYFKVKKELDYVKQYFPFPEKNIPNLLGELRALASTRKGEGV